MKELTAKISRNLSVNYARLSLFIQNCIIARRKLDLKKLYQEEITEENIEILIIKKPQNLKIF